MSISVYLAFSPTTCYDLRAAWFSIVYIVSWPYDSPAEVVNAWPCGPNCLSLFSYHQKLGIHRILTYADRLYLASYTSPPTSETIFPYGGEQQSRRSPSKRSSRAIEGPAPVLDKDHHPPCYFTVDDTLLYNAFHHDFGPLHIGHLYRFAVQFHDILGAPENKVRPVVFWSRADARSKFHHAGWAGQKTNR